MGKQHDDNSLSNYTKITQTESHGRGYIAMQDIVKGTRILEERPLVYALRRNCVQDYCHNCFKRISSDVVSCNECKHIYYCSNQCKEEDFFSFHKLECKLVQNLLPNEMTEFMRCCYRLMIKLFNDTSLISRLDYLFGGMLFLYTSLMTIPNLDEKQIARDLITFFNMMLAQFYHHGSKRLIQLLPLDRWVSYFCKLRINNISVYNIDSEIIGSGLFLNLSLFNHCCVPNCYLEFDAHHPYSLLCKVFSLKDIKKGEELTFSYITDASSYDDRKRELFNHFNFCCDCYSCKNKVDL